MTVGERRAAGAGGSHTYGESTFATTGDGRRLHAMVKGTGDPTVVFESGLGLSRSCWGLVQPAVAERTRTVVYDRAGTGRSDPDPEPRTLERLAGDLDALLGTLGPGPFVLVGHSWGGPVVRVAAAADPGRIGGLVLVDQGDEHCDLYFKGSARWRFGLASALLVPAARLGLYRMASRPGMVQPADVAADHKAEDFTVAAARAMVAEQDQFVAGLAALRERPPDLSSIEVSVLTGTRSTRLDRKVRGEIVAAHRRTAEATGGRLVEAPDAAHLIPFDQPDLVVDEILGMVG